MLKLAIAFCDELQELITRKINLKFEEVKQLVKPFEFNYVEQEKRISILEERLQHEVQKKCDLAGKRKKITYLG